MKYLFSLLFLPAFLSAQVELRYKQNQTLTYKEVIESYKYLADNHTQAELLEYGPTDSGRPLHLFVLAKSHQSTLEEKLKDKVVILVNNGIHPGESCGIDASIAFSKDILKGGISSEVVYAIIPIYNVGGSLNRGCCSRANQMGPELHGFRGNARNLDLNRDFIKADALNTLSFAAIFHQIKPHIFIDTHTSNGADYQYTMTLISTQKDKLNPVLSQYLTQELEPKIYTAMEEKGWEMIPYVNVFGRTPEVGYASFLETPRYASGYTALFNTIGFITEAHMLKPYQDRVEATRAFLHSINEFATKNSSGIKEAKTQANLWDAKSNSYALNWKLDSAKFKEIDFKGYKASYPVSKVTGQKQLKYYQDQAETFQIKYFDTYKPIEEVGVPQYYIVPQAWRQVATLLQYNGVEMIPFLSDTSITVSSYYATDFKFASLPYEGHFPLKEVEVEKRVQERNFLKGDYLVPTQQANKRFIVSVLEPNAVDSYLRWNFFDEIFQQKEWFSDYVYDETAEKILESDVELKQKFEEWKKENPNQSAYSQLYFIFKNTSGYELEHLRYPVARIE